MSNYFRISRNRVAIIILCSLCVAGITFLAGESRSTGERVTEWQPELSSMGHYARGDLPLPDPEAIEATLRATTAPTGPTGFQGDDVRVNSATLAPDYQTETTIAVNGNAVVVGYNDWRGFTSLGTQWPGISVSGHAFSTDGGTTWTDGGQLPLLTGTDRVYGNPDIKTWAAPNDTAYFYYASLYKTSDGSSSLCIHVSSDGGETWTTPREVTTATSATDFPDNLFMDVDPETGRIFVSWTNFGEAVTMRVAYSDDQGLTWNAPWVFATSGQRSVPRADGKSDFAYIAWRRGRDIVFASSSDNGVTWTEPATLFTGQGYSMNPYGFDHIHDFPSMAVSDTTGFVYIVYAARQLVPDFSDIYYTYSSDHGATFTAPQLINAAPGDDRAQFFPWISVDSDGRTISVIWYDQSLGSGTSDLTDVFHTHSVDDGQTWSCPTPVTDFSFHAEYGNTTSEPNLGDCIQAVSVDGLLYAAFGRTSDTPAFTTQDPDAYVDIHVIGGNESAPIAFEGITFDDTGCASGNGYWEPCETISLTVTVRDYSTCFPSITGVTGTLSTTHPQVTIVDPVEAFSDLSGQSSTASNTTPYQIVLDPAIAPGDEINFTLFVTSSAGTARLFFRQRIGRPVETSLLSENFDGVAGPTLPGGWSTTNLAGTPNPWVTSTALSASGPNSVFCPNIATTSLNQLRSPTIAVPPSCDLLEVSFDETHNIQRDSERRAWDGALMWIEVNASAKLAGSFATLFEPFYPWQMNRQSSTLQPRQDLACWSSDVTPNFSHVRIQYPGLALQDCALLFDMSTDDAVGTTSGMFIDNIEVTSIEFVGDCTDPPSLVTIPDEIVLSSVPVNQATCDTIYVINNGPSDLLIQGIGGCDLSPFSVDSSMTDSLVAKGDTTRLVVCVTPTTDDADTCTITITTNDPSGPVQVPVRLDLVTTIAGGKPPAVSDIRVVPNPFNPSTTIRFTVPQRMPVTAEVWSVAGERVRVLSDGQTLGPGVVELRWTGRNDRGETVGSGVYFIRIRSAGGAETVRAVLLK